MNLAQCGSCGNQLRFPDDSGGEQLKCPNCGSMVKFPAIAVVKPIKNPEKGGAEKKPNNLASNKKLIQPHKEKTAENQFAAVPHVSIVNETPNPKKEAAGKSVQSPPAPITAMPLQTAPANAMPAIAKAVSTVTATPLEIPANNFATTMPVPNRQPMFATPPQPTRVKKPQLENKQKFSEKKAIRLSPGTKTAVLYGSVGTALVVIVFISLVFIQKMLASGPAKTFEAYKIAVKNNDFHSLYDTVDSATRDTFDIYADAKSKESSVDFSLVGKDKFVAVATQRFKSIHAIKKNSIAEKLCLIDQATIVSESINRNRASVQVKFKENATESITFEKVDGEWKIGIPTFSMLFVEY